ncbi:GNAT family N-acetyltransferase [Gluconacetobacter tumulicola]|uniref:GNAT family N-acetyltransferase n=1 Tax=Gluconacetobacter tumulicola TaxID=1017177 RepID=A0A7W4P8K7_9PROT|nr:GNAT family N-acetyltransferase [Gluconacetobacter tumulicola]MBB2181094.1 GNAT family N-acetyltransferase [Gluconacetobacter tumulicola]
MFTLAVDSDIPEIVALMNRAYRGNTGSGWSTEEAYLDGDRTTEALLRGDLARKPSASMLKWEDERDASIVGCAWFEPIDNHTWYLGSLAIDPTKQKGGLGRIMLQAAEEWAHDRGAKRMRMSVTNVREALISWYIRRGYRRTGEIVPFPYGDDRFGRPLRDDLSFVVLEKSLETAAMGPGNGSSHLVEHQTVPPGDTDHDRPMGPAPRTDRSEVEREHG